MTQQNGGNGNWISKDDLRTLVKTVIIVVGLLIVSWFARQFLGLKDAGVFLITLIILPVFLFLIISGRLKLRNVSVFGISASFLEQKLEETTRKLQQEQERLVFLGKLEQALEKSREKCENLCLLYADIDGLRVTTWERFRENKKEKRAREPELIIRNRIRTELAECLEDAFFELTEKGGKLDLYELGEPDIIIMARGIEREKAREIAEAGKSAFKSGSKTHSATIALLCNKDVDYEKRTASEFDRKAEELLNTAKANEHLRGTVYPPP